MRVTIEKRATLNPHRRMSQRATIVRVTERCLILDVAGRLAYFDRATGKGLKGALGRPDLGHQQAGDFSGWTLRYADWNRWWLPGAKEE